MSRILSSLEEGVARAQAGLDQAIGALTRAESDTRSREARALLGSAATLLADVDRLFLGPHPDTEEEAPAAVVRGLVGDLRQLQLPASEEAPRALSVLKGGEAAPSEEPLPLVAARKTAEERREHLAEVARRRWGVGQETITRYLLNASEVLERSDLEEAAHWIADARTRLAYELHNAETAGPECLASWRETEHRLRLATDHLARLLGERRATGEGGVS